MFSLYIMFNNFKNLALNPPSTDSSIFPKYLCMWMHVRVGRRRYLCFLPFFSCWEKASVDLWRESGSWEAKFLVCKDVCSCVDGSHRCSHPCVRINETFRLWQQSRFSSSFNIYKQRYRKQGVGVVRVEHAFEDLWYVFLDVRKNLVIF